MTLKVDGTNGVLQSYDYQVLTTGFSYTFAAGTTTLVINPAGTLATGTITMPAAPADGMVITIESTQQVTAVTVSGNTGQTIVGAPVQLVPNRPLSYVYRLTNTTWYPMAGGTGRATSLVSGTSVASTSGTSIDFTGIPSWVKRITIMFQGVSTSGTSTPLIQIGAGSVETTGYVSTSVQLPNAGAIATTSATAGYIIRSVLAANVISGQMVITLIGSNLWVSSHVLKTDTSTGVTGAGDKTLSGTLDRVRITTSGGTDTFDAGSINILME